MIDSKFNEYGLANTETALPKHDKQLSVPVAAKKTALRDLQNDNRSTAPKSEGSSLLQKESGSFIEAVKVSGIKRGLPECLVSFPHHHSPVSNASNGHLVYVRRKPEAEPGKSSIDDNTIISADYPQSRILGHQDQKIQRLSDMKDSKICVSEAAPIARTSSECFASRKPSCPLSLVKFSNTSSAGSNYFHFSYAIPSLDCPNRTNVQHWEERYCQLQNLLKMLDQSNQDNYIQMLRSLSSVDLSRHAVELEKRSIQLSLEEGKELQRVRLLDVLGKFPKNSRAPSTQQDQSEK